MDLGMNYSDVAVSIWRRFDVKSRRRSYCTLLAMNGMARLSKIMKDPEMRAEIAECLKPYLNGEVNDVIGAYGKTFYRYGGNAAAFMLVRGYLPEAKDTLVHAAEMLCTEQPRNKDGLFEIFVGVRLAPETFVSALERTLIPCTREIVVSFVAKIYGAELVTDAVRTRTEPLALLRVVILRERHVATEETGVEAEDVVSLSEQFVRPGEVVHHRVLHFLHRFVGVVHLKQQFLLRYLHLQVHLLAHIAAGLAIGHSELYPHSDNEEQHG